MLRHLASSKNVSYATILSYSKFVTARKMTYTLYYDRFSILKVLSLPKVMIEVVLLLLLSYGL